MSRERFRVSRILSNTLEPLVYGAAISAYSGAVSLATLRSEKARKMKAGHRNVWKILSEKLVPGERYVWIHASSLGEFEQGRPLMERLRASRPELKILLTFFSPSGYEVRKNFPGADIVTYLPFDLSWNARKFVRMVKPEMAFFVKYEFWRNYLRELSKANIPTYLISGIFRESQLFFKPGMECYRAWLRCFSHLYVQDEGSRRLLGSIGIENVTVAGDTRFDRVTDIMQSRRQIPEAEAFVKGSPFTLCAGSSWPEDEAVYFPWLKARKEVRAIIAPHEFDETRISRMLAEFPAEAVTLSEVRKNPGALEGKRILIIDCFGLLSSIYSYCSAAFIGGAFGAGLHNINEAAVYGIPVVFGPRHHKFIEAREIIGTVGGFCVHNAAEASDTLDKLLNDNAFLKSSGENAGRYIRSKLGATEIIWHDLFN